MSIPKSVVQPLYFEKSINSQLSKIQFDFELLVLCPWRFLLNGSRFFQLNLRGDITSIPKSVVQPLYFEKSTNSQLSKIQFDFELLVLCPLSFLLNRSIFF